MEVDVVPENRESISDAMQKVDDKYHPVDYSTNGTRLRYSRPGENIVVDARRISVVGEQGNVGFPYELWIYEPKAETRFASGTRRWSKISV